MPHILMDVYSRIYARALLINYDLKHISFNTPSFRRYRPYLSESVILCQKVQPRKKRCGNTPVLFFDERACRAFSVAISRRRELTDVLVYLHPGAKILADECFTTVPLLECSIFNGRYTQLMIQCQSI
jgi:hypothetical protein